MTSISLDDIVASSDDVYILRLAEVDLLVELLAGNDVFCYDINQRINRSVIDDYRLIPIDEFNDWADDEEEDPQ